MPIPESRLEDLLFRFPHYFFPEQRFSRYARQLVLPSRGRLDMVFKTDRASWVFEVKAGTLKLDVANQIARYMNEAKTIAGAGCRSIFDSEPEGAVVAPRITADVANMLRTQNVHVFEIPEERFREVAVIEGIDLQFRAPYGTRNRFWNAFDNHLKVNGSPISIAKNQCSKGDDCNHADFRFSRPFWITFRCSTDKNAIDVDLTFGANAGDHFQALCVRRQEIDQLFEGPVLWYHEARERHVKVQQFVDVCDEKAWPSYFRWMQMQAEHMYREVRSL